MCVCVSVCVCSAIEAPYPLGCLSACPTLLYLPVSGPKYICLHRYPHASVSLLILSSCPSVCVSVYPSVCLSWQPVYQSVVFTDFVCPLILYVCLLTDLA